MRPRMPETHRQILGVPAPEAARARSGHLTPVVDVVLLEHARGAIIGLAADAAPPRAQWAGPPLALGHRRLVVLLEQPHSLARHAVHEAGCVVVRVAEGERVP